MARLIVIALAVLLVLPLIFAASSSSCQVRVTQSKSTRSNYVEYSATATNTGSTTATNVILSASSKLKSSSLTVNGDGDLVIPSIAAGKSVTFTFSVKKGNSVSWTTKCSSASAQTTAPVTPTSAPTKGGSSQTTTTTTKAPSNNNGGNNNGRICPTGSWWAPTPLTTWQWQLTGTIDTSKNVQMYDIDLFDASTSVIQTLHSQGKVVICYFSTQYENWRSDASAFPASVIGSALDGWPGENYVDIRATAVRNALNGRLDLAVSKGCDGVEPDNVDGYTAKSGFPLTANDQIDFNRYIATQAHARGLSVGLKNDVDQISALQPYFDWALNEQCKQYSECGGYSAFINANKAVFNCEYKGTASSVCPSQNTAKISALIKTLDLTAAITAQCCTSLANNCGPAPHTCKTSARRSIDPDYELVTPQQEEEQQEQEETQQQQRSVQEQQEEVAQPSTLFAEYLLPTAAASMTTFNVFAMIAVAVVALLHL